MVSLLCVEILALCYKPIQSFALSCTNPATMTSADFSLLPLDLSPVITARFVIPMAIGTTGGEASQDKKINFPCVLPDLLYGIRLIFGRSQSIARLPFPSQPYIRFLFVNTSSLLMASFRFRVAHGTLANR